MKQNYFLLLLILSVLSLPAKAQFSSKKNKTKYNILNVDKPARWIVGVKIGVNRTRVTVGDRYSVMGRSYNSLDYYKSYSKNNKLGPQVSVMATFLPLKNIGVTFQPSFYSYKYGYRNEYSWMENENNTPYYQLKFDFTNTLNYIELPLMAKYYLINGNIQAFIQGGGFYGKLLNAKKTIQLTTVDTPTEEEITTKQSKTSMDVNDLYLKTYLGWIAGGGVGFKADNFRFALEINYRKGINNITSEKNRFSNNVLINGFYDVPDNISFANWEASLSCSLPLDNLVHISKKNNKPRSIRRF